MFYCAITRLVSHSTPSVTHSTKQYSPSASITGDTHGHKVVPLVEQKGEGGEEEDWEGFEGADEFHNDWDATWNVEQQCDTVTMDKQSISIASNESSLKSSSNDKVESDLRKTLKGQLSEEDVQRLEEQAQWTKSVDLFVDMTPDIKKTVRHTTTTEQSSGQLNYNPSEGDMESDIWGADQGWNEEEF